MEITKEMIQNANDYISISEKEYMAEIIAETCIAESENGTFYERFAMKVMQEGIFFLSAYLKVDVTIKENVSGQEQYDEYYKDHIFNQIERLKTDTDIKAKIFDILLDYKEFCKFVDKEIERKLKEKNDLILKTKNLLAEHPEIKQKIEETK